MTDIKPRKVLGNLHLGQQVQERIFALNIQGDSLSTRISGEVVKLFETRNAGWATIRQTDGVMRLVCLG